MSSSDKDSKIDLLDPADIVLKKIKKAVAAPKVVEDNGIMAFVEFVLLPAAALRGDRKFIVERERDGLKPLVYTTIAEMHDDYRNDVVSSTWPYLSRDLIVLTKTASCHLNY